MNKKQQTRLITEIMEEDAKDGLYEDDVEKLADKHVESLGFITFTNDYSNERRSSFIDGYKKSKETLYTEEQVREAIKYALNEAKDAVLWIDTYHNIVSDKFIQSLKQPKKD